MSPKRYIFFRDDDVVGWNKRFSDFFDLFIRQKMPVIYGVVPGRVTRDFLLSLRQRKQKNPGAYDLVQHGWIHKDHHDAPEQVRYQISADRYRLGSNKYEFGPSRCLRQQKKDILLGWVKLLGCLEQDFTPVFVPPFHAYDLNTLKVINEMGARKNLRIFSAGKKTFPKKKNFLDLPAEMVFAPPVKGKSRYMADFRRQIESAFKKQPMLGILFHHDVYDREDLDMVKGLLMYLKQDERNRFLLFSELIHDRKRSKTSLVMEVTNACNLRCKACGIWKEKPRAYLNLEQVRRVLDGLMATHDINAVSLTGGEPFLNSKFDEIFRYLADCKARGLIDFLGIYSNGYDGARILRFLNENRRFLDERTELGISLDGAAANHNFLRGRPDAFQRTSGLLQAIRREFPQMRLSVKYTITPFNVGDLAQVYRFCRRNDLSFMPKLMESNNPYYYHRSGAPRLLSPDWVKDHAAALKKALSSIVDKERDRRVRIVDLGVLKALLDFIDHPVLQGRECYTPLYSLFVSARGRLHPCLNLPHIADLYDKRWAEKVLGPEHIKIVHKGLCGDCPGCLSYHGFFKKNINVS